MQPFRLYSCHFSVVSGYLVHETVAVGGEAVMAMICWNFVLVLLLTLTALVAPCQPLFQPPAGMSSHGLLTFYHPVVTPASLYSSCLCRSESLCNWTGVLLNRPPSKETWMDVLNRVLVRVWKVLFTEITCNVNTYARGSWRDSVTIFSSFAGWFDLKLRSTLRWWVQRASPSRSMIIWYHCIPCYQSLRFSLGNITSVWCTS